MTLKQLIYRRLAENGTFTAKLAKYGDAPAIFDSEAAPDQEKDWKGDVQYPRCDYVVDMQANEERSSVGTLSVTIYTVRDSMDILAMTASAKAAFRDIILNPEGDDGPYSLAWARTDGFGLPGTNIIGQTSQFDIVEYPDQETTDPDPQDTVARFLKSLYPDMIVLGIDRIGDVTDSAEKPVLYTEIRSLAKTNGILENQIAWLNCEMSVHVLCPEQNNNLKICAAVTNRITSAEYLIMNDGSEMAVYHVNFDRKADYLRTGQITFTAKYGVNKTAPLTHKMTDAVRLHTFNGGS